MKTRRGQCLDTADRQQVADRVLRQAAPADLIPVDVKTRSGPFSQLLEIESKRYVEQTLVDRQLPYATSEVGQRFRGVINAEINARILPLFACPTPVAGEPILFEEAPSIIAPTIVSAVRTKI